MDKLSSLLIGTGGIALVQQTPEVLNILDLPTLAQTIIQTIIGIFTIIGLFKKTKPKT